MQNLLSLINDNNFGSIHANMAGIASFFNGNVWFNINFSRNYCANSKLYAQTITLGWVIDSGANQHLTVSTVEMFNVVDITNLKIILGHPNGTLATISHVRNLKLSNNVVLYDVLVIPGYCDLKTKKIMGTDSEFGGLYLFDLVKDNSVDTQDKNSSRPTKLLAKFRKLRSLYDGASIFNLVNVVTGINIGNRAR
ncbi:hypothetical protein Tco_0657933 [Tanacetum coccineum]